MMGFLGENESFGFGLKTLFCYSLISSQYENNVLTNKWRLLSIRILLCHFIEYMKNQSKLGWCHKIVQPPHFSKCYEF